MELLTKNSLHVSRGYTYAYYTIPAKGNNPTLLLIHGYPGTSDEFVGVIRDYLAPRGLGVILPDALGYAGSSKPVDPAAYYLQFIAQDIKEILDKESLNKVVSLGHDWGVPIAQHLYNFYPDRVSGLVLLNLSYTPPSPTPFNLDDAINTSTQLFGYGTLWYWKLFTADNAAEVLESNLESCFDLAHGNPETWLETLCTPNGALNFLVQNKRQPTESYVTEEMRKNWIDQFRRDGMAAPLCYYRSMVEGVQDKLHSAIPPENVKVNVPFLFFGGKRDYVCRPEMLKTVALDAGLIPDCTLVVVDAGHWAHLALPKEFGEALVEWVKEKIQKS